MRPNLKRPMLLSARPSLREVILSWIRYYNLERPHQALGYQAPFEAMAIAA